MEGSRRIGFVDYNLENFHANVYLRALRTDLKERGFAVAGCRGMQQQAGREWAEKNDVPYCASAEELDACVDFYVVLAPSNPETHLPLCEQVFPFGKPTYVDKTFAPDAQTAEQIFALADRHGVRVETTSALRYTCVQQHVASLGRESVRHMSAWGGGSSFEEYGIHPVEMVVSSMGPDVDRIMRRGGDEKGLWQLIIEFQDRRMATVNLCVGGRTPYAAAVTTAEETRFLTIDLSHLFVDACASILDFFEGMRAPIDRAESLVVRRILDAALCGSPDGTGWVTCRRAS